LRCAEANARAHLNRWQIELPLTTQPGDVRVRWPGPAAGPEALPAVSIRRGEAWVLVHSARQPIDEARRLVRQQLGSRSPQVACVIGAGLGYVVDVVLERGQTRVLVLEPEPALVPWMLALRDRRQAISSGRLLILPGPDYSQRLSAWPLLTPLPDSLPVIANATICAARPQAARAARVASADALENAAANQLAGERFKRVMLLNTLRNLPVLAREAPVGAFAGMFARRPAVLVGAGPSLNRNIEQLRPYRDRAVLIAVGSALRPLLSAGLPPDLVVAVDPGEGTPLQFAGLEAPSTFLVADPSVDPSVFDRYRDRAFLFRIGRHEPWPWLLERGMDPGTIRSWGSVITSALHIGALIGCDPLVFIGTDLAYESGRTHALGSLAHHWVTQWVGVGVPESEAWSRLKGHRELVEAGIDGPCATSSTLVQFRDWIRQESAVLPRTLVNASGAGILSGGRIAVETLEAVLAGASPVLDRLRTLAAAHGRAVPGEMRTAIAAANHLRSTGAWPAAWLELAREAELAAAIGTSPA
jgi:hypothetical protein